MDQMNYPRGLIRYATENGLAHGWDKATLLKRVLRPRVFIYGALLLAVGTAFVTSLSSRSPVRLDVIRDRGVMARQVAGGAVENVYRLHLMNATESTQRYRIEVLGPVGVALVKPLEVALGSVEARTVPVGVRLPATTASALAGQKVPIEFKVTPLDAPTANAPVRERSTFHIPL